jgi:G:T-mismatch repair DNA endonuclease (very short patch repair protein)
LQTDLTFKKKHKIAILVDSEFFHGKDWGTMKKTYQINQDCHKKIDRNMQRDMKSTTTSRHKVGNNASGVKNMQKI